MKSSPSSSCFIGREGVLSRLGEIYRARENLLLIGPAGVGKSALLGEFARGHRLLFAHDCGCMSAMLADLEPQAGVAVGDFSVAQRVHRLLAQLKQLRQILVMDGLAKVPPRIAHFARAVLDFAPVWFSVRSAQARDVGHIWSYLYGFHRVSLGPLTVEETRRLLAAVEFSGDREELLAATPALFRLTHGNPGRLVALVTEMRARAYDLHSPEGLRLLTLHARITSVEAQLAADHV